MDKNENWTIFLKGKAYESDELQDYGIKIDRSKTILYKTGDNKKTIPAGNGIRGWLELGHSITHEANNLTKLTAAFTNSPTQQLLTDINNWTTVDGFITNGTDWTLPEDKDSMETAVDELAAKKLTSATLQADIAKQIKDKQTELTTKKGEISTKMAELDSQIIEITNQQREELKKYKINEGFSGDKKRSEMELNLIEQILLTIRYLENEGDATSSSSNSEENTAFTALEDIFDQINNCRLVEIFNSLAQKKDGGLDIQQAIKKVKDGKYTDENGKEVDIRIIGSVADYIQHFTNKANLVLLADWEKQALAALQQKEETPESLTDWQKVLKALDPLLTETVITESKMKDFQKHNNFKKVKEVENLLKKVIEQGKVKADFIELLKKEAAEVDDLSKMFTKFTAEEIIKCIKFYEYDKDSEDNKQKKHRLYSWARKKKVGDKYIEEGGNYPLSEAEKKIKTGDFVKFLFELATGEKSESSITKPTESSNNDNTGGDNKGDKWLRMGNWQVWAVFLGIPVAIIGLVAIIFREKIKHWWNPDSAEGTGETKSEGEE